MKISMTFQNYLKDPTKLSEDFSLIEVLANLFAYLIRKVKIL
jgi:hypothetical protein